MNEVNSMIPNITAKSIMSNYKRYKKFYNSKSESTRKKLLISNQKIIDEKTNKLFSSYNSTI